VAGKGDEVFADLLVAGRTLSIYGVDPRYPGPEADPLPEEAAEALRLAREVVGTVLNALPTELSP
jgi:hypothetical protein